MKRILTLVLGVLVFALTMFLSACSRPCPMVRPVHPPAVYLQQVEEPRPRGRTNSDLAVWIAELRAALALANSDKKAIREWLERIEKND